jgi:predicted DNA-binding transcriptional regulator YafY
MVKPDKLQKENIPKGNSEDSLLVIYILSILKKYSSRENPLSSQDVMEHLKNDYSIGISDAQRKKVRRHLDTLHESYLNGCIKKEEGKTRNGHKWYYDVSRDKFANEEGVVHETLSEAEIEFLVDLISATKILNSEGTRGMIDKLLKKTSISDEARERRLSAIQKESWLKTPNTDLVEKKDLIEGCFYNCCLTFDYEDEESITATPLGWLYEEGVCFLNAKVGEKYRAFELDKIRICDSDVDGYEDVDDFRRYDEETDSDKTALDSLFVNIPTIKKAIEEKKCLHFLYRSYRVANDRVISADEEKSILPHSLVFNDGKYYLIGIDEKISESYKIAYFRVDLMFELYYTEAEIKLSDWDKHIFETIERAREVEKHPLMMAGKDVLIIFKVAESALDRVIDDFAVTTDLFKVTEETRMVKDSDDEDFHKERVVECKVRTTKEEAYRWALANADAVELVYPQDLRDRIARIADPIYQLYTHSLPDKVRENLDNISKKHSFKISFEIDEDTAHQTYTELSKRNELENINNIAILGVGVYSDVSYMGDFVNAKRFCMTSSSCSNLSWASRLVNIEKIEFIGAEIADTSWMRAMKNLKWVYMGASSVDDLSVLSEHKNIDYLDISDTKVADISFIEKYQKLSYLNIVGCPIEDYSPLFTTKSTLKSLEIDESALEKIGEENIRKRHLGIDIITRKGSPFWRFLT